MIEVVAEGCLVSDGDEETREILTKQSLGSRLILLNRSNNALFLLFIMVIIRMMILVDAALFRSESCFGQTTFRSEIMLNASSDAK